MSASVGDVEKQKIEVQADVAPRYTVIEMIGAGSHGVVFSATDEQPAQGQDPRVAIKRIMRATLYYEGLVRVLREVLQMKHLKHPNVLALRDLFMIGGCVYIVTDLMESDLARVGATNQQFSDRHVRYFVYQLLSALEHLHSAGIMHRDVKPSNILVNSNCKLKLADLGLSREIVEPTAGSGAGGAGAGGGAGGGGSGGDSQSQGQATAQHHLKRDIMMTEYVCTRWYRAPELLLQSKNYDVSIDVWSAGCVGVELLTKRPLFPGRNTLDQLEKILDSMGATPHEELKGVPKEFLENYRVKSDPKYALENILKDVAPDLAELLLGMLAFAPERRLTVKQAMQHPALQEFQQRIPPVPSVERFFLSDLPERLEDLVHLLERSSRFSRPAGNPVTQLQQAQPGAAPLEQQQQHYSAPPQAANGDTNGGGNSGAHLQQQQQQQVYQQQQPYQPQQGMPQHAVAPQGPPTGVGGGMGSQQGGAPISQQQQPQQQQQQQVFMVQTTHGVQPMNQQQYQAMLAAQQQQPMMAPAHQQQMVYQQQQQPTGYPQ